MDDKADQPPSSNLADDVNNNASVVSIQSDSQVEALFSYSYKL